MESFVSPFSYFVFLSWSFFMLALIVYLTVFFLAGWKDFFKFH